jgi:hypothetical protein
MYFPSSCIEAAMKCNENRETRGLNPLRTLINPSQGEVYRLFTKHRKV